MATLGSAATAPVALIFCFDSVLLFTLTPFMMALSPAPIRRAAANAADVIRRIAPHSADDRDPARRCRRRYVFEPPVALDRLLAFLQTGRGADGVATRRHGGAVAAREMLLEVPLAISVVRRAPLLVLMRMSSFGPFNDIWVCYRCTDGGPCRRRSMCLIGARQYNAGRAGLERGALFGT